MLWCLYLSKLVFPFFSDISLGTLTLFEKLVEYPEVDGLAQKSLVSDQKSWWPVFRNAASSSMLTYGSFLFCSTEHCGQRHSTGWVAGSRRETFHSWQRSWGRRLGIRKGGIEPRECPRIFSSIYPPKTRVCLLYCFVLSPLTLLGAVPYHHLALSVKELTYSSN